MDDEYIGGALKLRKFDLNSKKKKKKSKKSYTSASSSEKTNTNFLTESTHILNVQASKQGSSSVSKKTEAERKFEEAYKKRLHKKVVTKASLSHKERVAKFNNYLENLSEHHDIPKVGPG